MFDGGYEWVAEEEADLFVDEVLGCDGVCPLACCGLPVEFDEEAGHEVVGAADAAVGAHEQAGGEDFVMAVEDGVALVHELAEGVEIEGGELEANYAGDGAEVFELIEGHGLGEAGEVIDEEGDATVAGDGFVPGFGLCEIVLGAGRETGDGGGTEAGGVSGEVLRFLLPVGPDVDYDLLAGGGVLNRDFGGSLAEAGRQLHAFAGVAADVEAVDAGFVHVCDEGFKDRGVEFAALVERGDNGGQDALEGLHGLFYFRAKRRQIGKGAVRGFPDAVRRPVLLSIV